MEKQVLEIYKNFDKRRKEFEALQSDNEDIEELRKLEQEIKNKKEK
jgi:hypothetical protein